MGLGCFGFFFCNLTSACALGEREEREPFLLVYREKSSLFSGVGGAADERNQGEHSALPIEYELLLPIICNNPILLVITQSKMLVLLV